MKAKSTTHNAEGLGENERLKAETLKAESQDGSVPQQTLRGLKVGGRFRSHASKKLGNSIAHLRTHHD